MKLVTNIFSLRIIKHSETEVQSLVSELVRPPFKLHRENPLYRPQWGNFRPFPSATHRRKPQNLNFSDGYREVRDPEKRRQDRAELHRSLQDYGGNMGGDINSTSCPKWLKYDRQVLRFFCYFKEPVIERRDENFRVRRCTIYFYLEDGSLHISEPRQDNSGIVQGTFLKRLKVPKAGGGYVTVSDFKLGSDITIYDRTFRICTVDSFTKRYILQKGFELGEEEDIPDQPLTAYQESMKRHRLKHHKDFATKQFLENDGKVLRFFAVWDDRSSVYGDRRPYVLHYFLADDTIEVLEINERNSGRHAFPMLLRRGRLPREIPSDLMGKNLGSNALPKTAYYKDTDLLVGSYVRVYNRDLLLHDCDEFTRNYYKTKYGVADDMLEPVEVQEPQPVLPRMEMPPHNGFGTDADSLQNCISLIPKPPCKDFNKILCLDGKVLCFSAKFGEDQTRKVAPQDKGRLFVFQFFLADDTIAIYEPPCRNSGIVGGKFLSRGPAPNKPGTSKKYGPSDMVVGAKIYVNNHIFDLIRADDWTLKWMDKHTDVFPMADIEAVTRKVQSRLAELPKSSLHLLKENLPSNTNEHNAMLTPDKQIAPLLEKAGLKLTEQELITIDRHISKGLDRNIAPDIQTFFLEQVSRVL
eukprot:Gb_07640 [translate_table: standard]